MALCAIMTIESERGLRVRTQFAGRTKANDPDSTTRRSRRKTRGIDNRIYLYLSHTNAKRTLNAKRKEDKLKSACIYTVIYYAIDPPRTRAEYKLYKSLLIDID